MDGAKLITICQFGGEFESNKDGTLLSYKGGEAHAVDVDEDTCFEDFKLEIAEMINCSSGLVSIKYFLPGNRKTLITISNDKDLKRMITFNRDSLTVDVFVTAGEIVGHDLSNTPASRSSRTTLSEAVVPLEDTPIDIGVNTQPDHIVDSLTDIPVDSAPPILLKSKKA
ncbi:hypothetical protein IFM89_025499 [Coptis chinensis]|uniref:PB1 domain-containing protein n=1 Tax=Coptis chinensis TaxID=261450 RepID=A0A835H7L4_9MAGN|nr:hypothetical protein IFM89_025499 [Coptis chinensis]